VEGLLWLLGWTLVVAAVLALALRLPRLVSASRRVLLPSATPPPTPEGRAIEDVAAALRRLRPLVVAPGAGVPMARRAGTTAAYDDLLAEAARALDVPDDLSGLPPGTDRDAERLRLEHLLRERGLRLD
jgi:hypothetical protein